MASLQGLTLIQINSSAALLAVAKQAGFDSIQAFMPGLQMFWDDVSWAQHTAASNASHATHAARVMR
jgi:hypothetical protein